MCTLTMYKESWNRSFWRGVEKKTDKIVLGRDFNQADVKCPEVWKKFLAVFYGVDVHPTLATYLHAGGSSALDRFIVPEDWVCTARWNPEVRTLNSSQTNGHKILKLNVRVRVLLFLTIPEMSSMRLSLRKLSCLEKMVVCPGTIARCRA